MIFNTTRPGQLPQAQIRISTDRVVIQFLHGDHAVESWVTPVEGQTLEELAAEVKASMGAIEVLDWRDFPH